MSGEETAQPGAARPAGGHETIAQKPVAVIDNGAQLGDVIYWNIVESGLRADVIPFHRGAEPLDIGHLKQTYGAFIFSGGGDSVNADGSPQIPIELLDGEVASMGFCYGAQGIAKTLGGVVGKVEIGGHHHGEYGSTEILVDPAAVIYSGLRMTKVLMSHGDSILVLPTGFRQTGWSGTIVASFESEDGRIVGTQFHPEVKETEHGFAMIQRFLTGTANLTPDEAYTWEVALDEYVELEKAKIAEILRRGDVISGFVSGGVDSTTAALLTMEVAREHNRTDQVQFFYVNTGLMRIEDDSVVRDMQDIGLPVEEIDLSDEFFVRRVTVTTKDGQTFLARALQDEDNQEIKRLIIGNAFRELSEELKIRLGNEFGKPVYFLQGTNLSDLVESGSKGGKQIKGHHNVEAMDVQRKAGELVEPFHGLMKYHIRHLAERLGLPEKFFQRQPFPGVGLGPRIIVNLTGEITPPEAILQERLDGLVRNLAGSDIFAHIVNMQAVGVKGDDRSLANVVFLDGDANWQLLSRVGSEATNKIASINRAFYSPIPINRENISGTVTRIDKPHAASLKLMEEYKRQLMDLTGLDPYLSQHFVATLWPDLHNTDKPTLALRLFITGDKLNEQALRRHGGTKETFRTGVAAVPGIHVPVDGFSFVMSSLRRSMEDHGALVYDLTDKPPGSTEYE